MSTACRPWLVALLAGGLALGPARIARAWETNDDAFRILGSRLGPDGALFANLATLIESIGGPAQKRALQAAVPAEVVGPFEHLPVDVPFERLPQLHKQRFAAAFLKWIATAPALAAALRAAETTIEFGAPRTSPSNLDAFTAPRSGDPSSPQQLDHDAIAFLVQARESAVRRLARTRPRVAARLLAAFETHR